MFLLVVLVLGLSVLPFTAGAVGSAHQAGSITETGQGVQATEANGAVALGGVTVDGSVFRSGDTAFVWLRGANGSDATGHRVDVALSGGASDGHVVCLGETACEPVPNRSGPRTVSFPDAVGSDNRTTVDVTLRGPDGETVDEGTLSVWRIAREHDLDRDGVSNEREAAADTSLVLSDTDDDGLSDERELGNDRTNATVADTDGDGLDDGRELELGADPTTRDTDGDGLDDAREAELGTDPTAADTDGDGLDDAREVPLDANATVADTDGDGLLDGRELELGADPTVADTDDDGLVDGREAELGADPTVADTDGDGLDDAREVELGTDPDATDTDGDGLADAREVELGTDPTATDTDGDGLDDGRELELGADPTVADTDGDGLDDGDEVAAGTDPTTADTDGDFLSDGTEADLGFDPTNTYTPGLYGSGVVGFLLGIAVAVSATDVGPLAWLRSSAERTPEPASAAEEPADDPAPAEPVRAEPGDDGEPDDGRGSTARDVFERHQDALVTDAERTVRMLEAEGGQLKQSEIVDATSWSKAKVSRLLSRMADDDDVVKVSIGRENLICLPEQTPESARTTDRAARSAGRLVSPTTGG